MSEPIEEMIGMFCLACDNLGDMPISEEWASTWSDHAQKLLFENDFFRAHLKEAGDHKHCAAVQAVQFRKLQRRFEDTVRQSELWKERFKKLGGHRALGNLDRLALKIEALTRANRELRAAALPLCMCKDRLAKACPGEWEAGCDLGNNEKFVRVHE